MSLSDIVSMTITAETQTASRAGFGVPGIVSYHTVFPERTRVYTAVADMVTDGFATTDPAVLAATAAFAASPRPTQVVVGRSENDEPMVIKITPSSAIALHDYTLYVNGQEATHTSVAVPSVATICTGLKVAIDALALSVTVADNSTDITITANAVADKFTCYMADPDLMRAEDNTPDGSPGIVADLTAIFIENDDCYGIEITNQGTAVIAAAAAYMSTLKKIYIASTLDHDVVEAGSSDVGSTLQTAAYDRIGCFYHPKANVQFPTSRWYGACLPYDPGSITWKFKTLTGLDYSTLTSTEITNLRSKNVNFYNRVNSLNMTEEGYFSAGTSAFIDITRSLDFIEARMQEAVFTRLKNSLKVPYTDPGIALIEAEVRGVLQLCVGQDILAADPAYTVTVPLAASATTADKGLRILRSVEFEATLAGAIHSVQIAGRILI